MRAALLYTSFLTSSSAMRCSQLGIMRESHLPWSARARLIQVWRFQIQLLVHHSVVDCRLPTQHFWPRPTLRCVLILAEWVAPHSSCVPLVVKANIEFSTGFASSLTSDPVALWISAVQTSANEPPRPLDICVERFSEDLGVWRRTF